MAACGVSCSRPHGFAFAVTNLRVTRRACKIASAVTDGVSLRPGVQTASCGPQQMTPLPLSNRQKNTRGNSTNAVVSVARRSAGIKARHNQVLASASSADGAPSSRGMQLKPAKLKQLAAVIAVAAAVLISPRPDGLSPQAWNVLALFLSTMAGIVLQPLPMGAVALLALAVAVATKVLTWSAAFTAFSAEVPWLIVSAMFIAQGFKKTGLGNRLALSLVVALGRWGNLGLAYGLVAAEALLSPMIPSVAGRAGGVLLPVTTSLAEAAGSRPDDGTARRLGSYLVATLYQTSVVSSAMFLTANHPNPLVAQLALSTIGITLSWGQWALAAIVPGITSLLLLPLFVYKIYPPEASKEEAAEARIVAEKELTSLGSFTAAEAVMSCVLAVTLCLWVMGQAWGISPSLAAIGALGALLVTGVLSWDDCLSCKSAWNTLVWFAALIALSGALRSSGVVAFCSDAVASSVSSLGLGWQPSFLILLLVYILSHVFFASNIAHVSAMLAAFLGVVVAAGTPPALAAMAFACFSNMMGGFTPYGMSHAPMYFGSGYVSSRDWWMVGLGALALNLIVWLVVGGAWWKVIGLW